MSDISIERIWPEWKITGLLGKGAFGSVYLAESGLDGKTIYAAVKVVDMPPSGKTAENAKEAGIGEDLLRMYFGKFKNNISWELTMFKSLATPPLVSVDSLVVEDDKDGIGWTGYVRTALYTPLDKYFANSGSTAADAVRLGRELCPALVRCESFGMRHGGIKPANVLVTDAGSFMLCDFGVRRCLEKAGTGMFEAQESCFDAPELSENRKYTAASEIYSLGMVMAYVANGCRMPDKDAGIKDAPPGFADIIRKAAERDPAGRYASARELLEALGRLEAAESPARRTTAAANALETIKAGGAAPEEPRAADAQEDAKRKRLKNIIVCAAVIAMLIITLLLARPWRLFAKTEGPPVAPSADVSGETPEDGGGEVPP